VKRLTSEESVEPHGRTGTLEPPKEILQRFDEELAITLREAYRADPHYPWTGFMGTVNLLISQGYLAGKGDGFVVRYFLTKKGKDAVAHNGSSHLE
jgi:hypothetical protein